MIAATGNIDVTGKIAGLIAPGASAEAGGLTAFSSWRYDGAFSVCSIIRFIIETAWTGKAPDADSADRITASAASKTAVAASDVSARVGTAEFTIDSSICVATTTGFPASRHKPTIRFWITGTSSGGNSTPISPRAIMIASEAS